MGWWEIHNAESPGIGIPAPGELANKLPGDDDDSRGMYIGDTPADLMSACLSDVAEEMDLRRCVRGEVQQILENTWDQQRPSVFEIVQKCHEALNAVYRKEWERPMEAAELAAVINFVTSRFEDEGFDELYEDPRPGDWEPSPLAILPDEVAPDAPAAIDMLVAEYEGKPYGAGVCTVSVAGTPVESVAVLAGDERFICTAINAISWLFNRGLPRGQATRMVKAAQRDNQHRDVEKLPEADDAPKPGRRDYTVSISENIIETRTYTVEGTLSHKDAALVASHRWLNAGENPPDGPSITVDGRTYEVQEVITSHHPAFSQYGYLFRYLGGKGASDITAANFFRAATHIEEQQFFMGSGSTIAIDNQLYHLVGETDIDEASLPESLRVTTTASPLREESVQEMLESPSPFQDWVREYETNIKPRRKEESNFGYYDREYSEHLEKLHAMVAAVAESLDLAIDEDWEYTDNGSRWLTVEPGQLADAIKAGFGVRRAANT